MATISAARTKRYAALKVKQATGPLTTKEAEELDTLTLALAAPPKRRAPRAAAGSQPAKKSTKAKGAKK